MSSPSSASTELPAVDEHLAVPECGYEIDDGKLVRVSPALEPHADRHSKLAALLEAHAAGEFNVAIDMLTRTSLTSDFAPDASVYPRERDPKTGGRQLEHLAFEVVSTESLGHAGDKARSLAARGVRRVFAIDVERARAFEWSGELGTWSILDGGGAITDPVLAVPLPVRALLQAAKADDAVAAALLAKRNPVLTAALDDAEARGMARAILAVLASRGLAVSPHEQEQLLGERDPARLTRWLTRAASCASAAELLALA
jgi:Uma2 family endonuclease